MRLVLVGFWVLVGCASCSGGRGGDGLLPVGPKEQTMEEVGPKPKHPPSRPPPPPVPLTETNVREFLRFVNSSVGVQRKYIREQLDAARKSDKASKILDEIFDVQSSAWRIVDGRHIFNDSIIHPYMGFEVIKHFRSRDSIARLVEYVWRPLPSPEGHNDSDWVGVGAAEIAAVQALVCAEGSETEVERVIKEHPEEGIRKSAIHQQTDQWCNYMETAVNP